jgi:hypothetical protein
MTRQLNRAIDLEGTTTTTLIGPGYLAAPGADKDIFFPEVARPYLPRTTFAPGARLPAASTAGLS